MKRNVKKNIFFLFHIKGGGVYLFRKKQKEILHRSEHRYKMSGNSHLK